MRVRLSVVFRCAVVPALALVSGCAPNGVTMVSVGVGSQPATTTVSSQPVADGPFTDVPASTPSSTDPSATSTVASVVRSDIDVAVLGDSLTVSATDEIVQQIGALGVGDVSVHAFDGRKMVDDVGEIPSGLSTLRSGEVDIAQTDVWVVALGTNDVGAAERPEELADNVRTLLSELGADGPIVWLDVYIAGLAPESKAFGEQLREIANGHSSMVIADWYNPAQVDGMLLGDGVHLTSDGRTEFAATMAGSLAAVLPPA